MVGGDHAVEGAFGVNDHNGTESAKTETSGHNDLNGIVYAARLEKRFKLFADLGASRRSTSRTAAHKYLSFEFAAGSVAARAESHFLKAARLNLVKGIYRLDYMFHILSSFRPLSVAVFCKDSCNISLGETSVDLSVDGKHGSQTAGAYAARCVKRISAVLRYSAHRDIKLL